MSKFLKLDFVFDSPGLMRELAMLEQKQWLDHYNQRDYVGSWDVLPLRSVGGRIDNINSVPGNTIYANTALLEDCPCFREVIDTFECPQKSIRLMRLAPGSTIREHRDDGLGFLYGEARLHIPIATNPDVKFIVDGKPVVMKSGECWYVDFTMPHHVFNGGSEPRIHLVIDLLRNDWLDRVFYRCGYVLEQHEKAKVDENITPENLELVIAELRKQDSPIVEQLIRQLRADIRSRLQANDDSRLDEDPQTGQKRSSTPGQSNPRS